jgi:AbrB family looped-hinge helix DNA binding protein
MQEKMTYFISSTKVGPKGQIVIPKEIREMFGIESGESLIIMADLQRGIAIQKQSVMEGIAKAIFDGDGMSIYPKEDSKGLGQFADAIKSAVEGERGEK